MTKETLIESIKATVDEKYTTANGITFTIEDGDDTIYARREGIVAFCTKSSDVDDWYQSSSIGHFTNCNNVFTFMRDISEYIGFDFKIEGQILRVKEKEVVIEKEGPSTEQYRLGGMVEAYEKILTNRDLTVGK